MKLERNNKTYDLFKREESRWVEVRINGEFEALVMDKTAAFQVVYKAIKKDVGYCEVLSESSFL